MKDTDEATLETAILNRLHFRELAFRFLDGMNPLSKSAIVIADAICSYHDALDTTGPMRYEAHAFVQEAMKIIERGDSTPSNRKFNEWLQRWNAEFGV